jgi:predicted metalloendopeptidase
MANIERYSKDREESTKNDALDSLQRALAFDRAAELKRIGRQVDPHEWPVRNAMRSSFPPDSFNDRSTAPREMRL